MTKIRDDTSGSGTRSYPRFIVFEGIDGSGKSTQARMLAQRLREEGLSVVLTAEPSDGPVGAILKALASRPNPDEEARLFTDDRRDHLERVILPALSRNRVVVCDRYVYSSAAYQGARGLDPQAIIASNCSFAVPADVTFILEVPVDQALARLESSRTAGLSTFEDRENLEAVAKIYESLDDRSIIRINGARPPREIHEDIVTLFWSLECRNAERVDSMNRRQRGTD